MVNESILKEKKVEKLLRDGRKYTFLPLTLNELIEIWPLITKIQSFEGSKEPLTVDHLKLMRELMYKVLKTACDDITEDKAGDLVDIQDITAIIQIVVGQNEETIAKLKK